MAAHEEIDLSEYRKAMEEELRITEERKSAPIKEVEELKQPALDAIGVTLRHSHNEALKTRTAMWVVDKLLDHANREDDKVIDFLKGLPTATPSEIETSK